MTDLPPPGWYDDPTAPNQERWWDGEKWSEQTRRKASEDYQYRPGELRPVGEYLGHAFGMIRARWDNFLLVTVIGSVVLAVLALGMIRPVVDAIEINGIDIDGFGSSQLGLVIAFAIVFTAVSLALTMSQYRIAWSAATGERLGWATAFQYGLTNFLRIFGWMFAAIFPLFLLFVVLLALPRGIGALGVILLLALFVATAYWVMVVSFIPVALVAQPRGTNPISVSFATVRRRWWRVFGRFLVMGLIAGIAVQVINGIFGALLGSTFFGLEFVPNESGEIEFVKDLGNPLQFFLTTFVFLFVSFVGQVATYCGATSMAFDVMPGPDGRAIGDELNQTLEP